LQRVQACIPSDHLGTRKKRFYWKVDDKAIWSSANIPARCAFLVLFRFVSFHFAKQAGKNGDFIMTNDQVRRYTTEELKNLEKSGGDKTDW